MPKINTRAVAALAKKVAADSPPKWRKGTKVDNLLRDMLNNGLISAGATPKEVHQMKSEFLAYPLATFRQWFYKAKNETGFNLRRSMRDRDEEGGSQDDDSYPPDINEFVDDDDDAAKVASAVGTLTDNQQASSGKSWHWFKPMSLFKQYKDSTTKTDRVVGIIVAPSGVCNEDMASCHLEVLQDCKTLQYTSNWPLYSLDMEALHANMVKKATKSGKISEAELRDIYKRCEVLSDLLATMRESENKILASSATFDLPIKVSRKVDKAELLGCRDGTRLIYIVLKAEESTYRTMATPTVDFIDAEEEVPED